MKEIEGDIFTTEADGICVTTNGIVKGDGQLVMGAGIAKEFAKKFPYLPGALGRCVSKYGNHVVPTWNGPERTLVISFPTKHDWKNPSDIKLIEQSAHELVAWIDKFETQEYWDDQYEKELVRKRPINFPLERHTALTNTKILLSRPGCGMGGLKWPDVKAVLEPILDDRFHIITPKSKS